MGFLTGVLSRNIPLNGRGFTSLYRIPEAACAWDKVSEGALALSSLSLVCKVDRGWVMAGFRWHFRAPAAEMKLEEFFDMDIS